ncbi:MAG: hypothetical protein ACFB0B_12795 [Thermonemataceae bacterium]
MIYVATQEENDGSITAFLAKNKNKLKELGFRWISTFKSEQNAVIWINESYGFNFKEYLY